MVKRRGRGLRTPAWLRGGCLAAVLTATIALAACGDDEADTSSAKKQDEGSESPALAEARERVEAAKAVPEFAFDGPAFDVTKAQGKTIYAIPLSNTNPYVAQIDREMAKVAELAGVNFVSYKNEGLPEQQTRGIQQAVATKADVIVLQNLGPETLMPPLREAKKAGIPIISAHWYANDAPLEPEPQEVLAGTVTAPFAEAGQLVLDYAAVNNGDEELRPLVITEDAFPISATIKGAIKDELAAVCPDCEYQEINVPLTEWQTKMQSAVRSELTRDPKINWVLPLYDSMSLGVQSAIKAMGKTGKVRIASFNGTDSIMKLIQDGDDMAADVGEDPKWIAWAIMDQAMRMAAGEDSIADGNEKTPLRIFDDSNIDETGTPPVGGKGYGDAYISGYKQLWGLE
jgi:ribose transport system substrate-binding protein